MEKSAKRRKARIVTVSAVGAIMLCAGALGAYMVLSPGDNGPPQKDMTVDAAARNEVLESLISTLNGERPVRPS